MLQLEDSWIYQAGVDEVVERVRMRAIDLSRERFGRDPHAERRIQDLRDSAQLAELISYLRTATSLTEAFSAAGVS